mgnify:CR=1 FL=1
MERKLGVNATQRIALIKNQASALLWHGKITTTEARAKEVQSIAERLIGIAVREADNFTSKQKTVSAAKTNSKGKVLTVAKTSKNGRKYNVVEREVKTELVRVDDASRLAARRQAIAWIYNVKDANGESVNVVNKLFDEIAPKYKDVNGGYCRIIKTGARRGDASEMCIIELIDVESK